MVQGWVLATVAVLLLVPIVPHAHAQSSVLLYDSSVNLTYTTDGTYLYGTVYHDYQAWVGIGWHEAGVFPSEGAMYSCDYVIAQFNPDGSIMNVLDYVSDSSASGGQAPPLLDTTVAVSTGNPNCTNDILVWSGFQTPTASSFSFKKALRTNDAICDRPITNATQLCVPYIVRFHSRLLQLSISIVWARGSGPGRNTLGFHGTPPSTHGSLTMNFLSYIAPPPALSGFDYAPVHGSLMFAAFGVLMTFGIFVGRYLKRYWWWFPLHITLQSCALGVIVIAFSMALKMVSVHFYSVHSKIGFTAICLSFVSPVLGIIADRMYDPKRESLPWWPDYTHWIFGRLALFFGWAAIILGILIIGLPKSVAIAAGCLFALYIILYFATDIMKKFGGNDYTPAGSDPINAPFHDE